MTDFDDRWRQLASAAAPIAAAPLPADLARRARQRPAEPIPFLSPRWAAALTAAAAVLTVALFPLAISGGAPAMEFAVLRPPGLPSPPTIESPGHYLALVRTALKGISP